MAPSVQSLPMSTQWALPWSTTTPSAEQMGLRLRSPLWAVALLAAVTLSGCGALPTPADPTAGLWWFASLALVGLGAAGFAFGRLIERRARAAELFEARSCQAALVASLADTAWRSDASHRMLPAVATAAAETPAAPPSWWTDPDLRHALAAQRPFSGLPVSTIAAAATTPESAASGRPSRWLMHGQPLLDAQGRFAGFVGTARALDAAEKRTETAAQTSAEISTGTQSVAALDLAGAESNEADSFSITVAHDLRAPIRVVDGFTRIVQEDYGHLLDRVANDHLERVLNAAARMNKMIDALLTLARLSNQPLTRQPVNLSQIAHYVIDELRRSQPGREVEVAIEDGLQAVGDPTLLRLVLENLLGNAWKYSARTPKAQIALASVPHGNGRAYMVRDNGAGFDMRAAERLFGVFQRLHSASEFAGHGVGLASTRRIVRRHGGEIWAEAEPARGAAFTFTLAAA